MKERLLKLILKALLVYAEFPLQSADQMNLYDTLYPYPDSVLMPHENEYVLKVFFSLSTNKRRKT